MSWVERTELLLGAENTGLLCHSHVLVVGLGGVGAYAAEMVARAGVGRMTIVDADSVSESNINRQVTALHSTVGYTKAKVMAKRLYDINPDIELTIIDEYIRDKRIDELLNIAAYDYIIDAIDTLSPKANLIKGCLGRGIRVVSSMGAGAKTDPTKVEIKDISKTHHCPLAHMLRKRLHKMGIYQGFYAVFSPEPVRKGSIIICEEQNKKSNVGSISYMPAVFGCACASVVILGLIGEM
jgi:tRNA A37 threonylcarbamoyladenosine dehydratase